MDGATVLQTGSTDGLLVTPQQCAKCKINGWGWKDGSWSLAQASTITFGQSGMQTIRVQPAEDGVEFDQIVLSPDAYLHEAPGAATKDNTIVAR